MSLPVLVLTGLLVIAVITIAILAYNRRTSDARAAEATPAAFRLFWQKFTTGPDQPWVIFSNSLITNLSMWDDQVAGLENNYRILRYDQRGHGGTQATDGPYSFDMLVTDVIALMDALAIPRAQR